MLLTHLDRVSKLGPSEGVRGGHGVQPRGRQQPAQSRDHVLHLLHVHVCAPLHRSSWTDVLSAVSLLAFRG